MTRHMANISKTMENFYDITYPKASGAPARVRRSAFR
jgi:hypothetical protein